MDQMEWISVNDRLPDNDTDVLLLFPRNMAVGYYHYDEWSVASGDDMYTCVREHEERPTHWMPLPAPPVD